MVVRITRIDSRFADIPLPQYVTVGAAGMDLCAAISKRLIVHPGKTMGTTKGFSTITIINPSTIESAKIKVLVSK